MIKHLQVTVYAYLISLFYHPFSWIWPHLICSETWCMALTAFFLSQVWEFFQGMKVLVVGTAVEDTCFKRKFR